MEITGLLLPFVASGEYYSCWLCVRFMTLTCIGFLSRGSKGFMPILWPGWVGPCGSCMWLDGVMSNVSMKIYSMKPYA